MSLLSVTVKKARFVCEEAEQFNSYVTLKLQNVKSTTVTVKGANPCWEQDFLFETNDMNTGLLIEVWCKGFLWDRFLGYYYVPLSEVSYMNEEGSGQWVCLDSELEMRGADIIGTKKPTGHSLLIDCRLELPFDPENTEAADLQRKLEMLNNMMDQEARAEQARRQILYNIGHAGYSEDSDYTSDLNYPVGGQGANSSASQFRTAANQLATPQRSLETSRENSYERDDHQIPATVGGRLAPGNYGSYGGSGHSPRYDEPYPEEGPPQRYSQSQHATESSEPLFYNSRPRHYKEYRRRKHTWDYEDSQDGWYSEGYDYPSTRVDETRIYSDTEYYPSTTTSSSRRRAPPRRPSLERQMTLYDDHPTYYTDGYSSDGRVGKMSATYPECQTDIRYNEYYDTITGYVYQDERYGQDDEDRQWDSGGKWYPGSSTSTYYENKRNRKTLPQRPASSIGIHRPDYRPTVTRQRSYESEELNYSSHSARRRKPLQPQQRPTSRQEGTGKKLPPTPTKPSSVILSRKLASLPATPSRQLPKTRTPSEESYYKSDYNEDYNYAYRSQDNLPQESYTESVYGEQISYDQVHASDKTRYPEVSQDRQYGSSYVAPVDDQYSRSYQEPPTQDVYDQTYAPNSYKDEYQQQPPPHAQQKTQVYQEAYQETTYPNASQANDQYAIQANDQYTGQPNDQYTGQPNDQYTSRANDQYISRANDQYTSRANDQYTSRANDQYTSRANDQYTSRANDQYGVQPNDQYSGQANDQYGGLANDQYTDQPNDQYIGQANGRYTSQANDQYNTTQLNDQYRKSSRDMIIEDNYQVSGYDQNNVQYQEPYKEDSYQEQYSDYGVTVPSSVYDQNNMTKHDTRQYDSQYNINTSTGYQKTYQQEDTFNQDTYNTESYKQDIYNQDTYNQDTYNQETYNQETYNQTPVTSQSNYQETYTKQQEDFVDYQTPYSKSEDVGTTYKNNYQDGYQDYQDQYEDSYHDSYQGSFEERYKESPATTAERRQSEVPELSVTTPRGQTRTNGYQSNETEYFYPSQEDQQVSSVGLTRRSKLEKRDTSQLLQQNTDSLESRDDELKDSFETAVSSVSSSQQKKGFSEYSTAGDSSPAAPTLVDSPQSSAPIASTVVNHVPTSMTVTAMIHAGTVQNGKRLVRAESYQEEVIGDEEYTEIIPKEPQRKDSQLSHQSQLSQLSQHSQHSQHSSQHSQLSQKPKLTRGDSYASDHFPEESYSRRGSYAMPPGKDSFSSTTQESFKPPLARTDSYQDRGGYGQNTTAPQPISRAESYQRGYFKDQETIEEPEISLNNAINGDYKMRDETLERYERGEEAMIRSSREDSLADTFKATPPMSHTDSPRGSITKQASLEESVQMDTPPRSPPEPPPDEELLEMVGAAPVPTQLKERPEMTARERWAWAIQRIIMQLNVSTASIC